MTFIQEKVEGFIDTFLHSDRVVSNIIGKKDTYTYRFKRQVNCYSMIRWLTTTLTACLEEGKRMERNRILEIAKAEHSVSYGESAKAQEIIIRRIEALTPIKPHYGAGVEYEYTTPTTMSHHPNEKRLQQAINKQITVGGKFWCWHDYVYTGCTTMVREYGKTDYISLCTKCGHQKYTHYLPIEKI